MNKEKESKDQTTSEKDQAIGEESNKPADQEAVAPSNGKSPSENGKSEAKDSPDEMADEKNTTVETTPADESLKDTLEKKEEGPVKDSSEGDSVEVNEKETSEVSKPTDSPEASTEEETGDDAPIQAEEPAELDKDASKSEEPSNDQSKDEKAPDEPAAVSKKENPVNETKVDVAAGKEKAEEGKTEIDKTDKDVTDKKAAGEEAKDKEGLESEDDLKEKDDDDHHDDEDEADYSVMSKEELVEVIKELAKSDQIIKAEKTARDVKHAYDEIRDKEREEALKKFVAEGGEAGDFAYRPDELTLRFDANYQLVRDRKSNFVKNKEQQKETNLKRKEEILEKLREFVDSEETNISFESFKALQEEWKSIGPVPGGIARSLWANYNALVDRFYDKRSIYFELKELDRKKNLEAKGELCVRAEALAEVTNINEAIKELNELHHEFKHIGPVPKEEQEPLWQRFKAASDAVYERRKAFVEHLKGELDENLKVKLDLAEQVKEFASFNSDRIKAWNEKTKNLLEIQKKWENTGGLPRAKAKEINRTFWSSFKQFFSNKNQFFKKLDAERETNLEKKKDMVERAKALQESKEWHETAEALKALQREWKDVGPVPGKFRESIYKEFKAACDAFFDRKRSNQEGATKEYTENYKHKVAICDKIKKLAKGDKNNLEEFKSLQEEYNETGFVPRNKISEIRNRYTEVVNDYVKALDGISEEEKQRIKIENQVSDILHSPNADQKLYRKEQSLRKQISSIENDISVWKNNLEFFADSKKANKLKDEFQSKIDSANDQLQQLKQQLKIIRTA